MKKTVFKILIIIFGIFITILNGFCADIDLSRSFVSDDANLIEERLYEQLSDVLKNLHKETGCDIVVVTLDSLKRNENFSTVEKQIKTDYLLGGKKRDKWVIITVTKTPYKMDIRVGKGLKKVITGSTVRGMKFEFLFSRLNNYRNEVLNTNRAGRDLYNTTMFLAELVADKNNARLHTSEFGNEIMGDISYLLNGTRQVYYPQTDPTEKFIRRNNLHTVIALIIIGAFPFLFRHHRRRRFRRRRF
ncbi:TPM domain-containing protein [bacterium]|nr:TPM domain-containing protein [bacterium]